MMRIYLTIALCFFYIISFSQNTYVKSIPLKVTYANDIVYTPNGDCIFTQMIKESDSSQSQNLYSIRTNKNGKTLWEKAYGISSFRASLSYMKTFATSDNGLLVFTKAYDLDLKKQTSLILKTDSLGNVQWSKSSFAVSGYFEIRPNDIIEDAEGNFILLYTLRKTTNIYEDYKLQIVKLNTSGDIIFQTGLEHLYEARTYQNFYPSSITEMKGGGYAITLSYDCAECQDGPQPYLLYTNKSGGIISYTSYGPSISKYGEYAAPIAIVKKGNDNFMFGQMLASINNNWVQKYYCIPMSKTGAPLGSTLIPMDTFALQKFIQINDIPYLKMLGSIYTPKHELIRYQYARKSDYGLVKGVILAKYDSLGRLCPNGNLHVFDTLLTRSAGIGPQITGGRRFVDTLIPSNAIITVTSMHASNTDCSGSFETVAIQKPAALQLSITPNPVNSAALLRFSSTTTVTMWLTIVDVTGNIFKRESLLVSTGKNSISLNLSALPHGAYLLNLTSKTQNASVRFVKE